MALYEGRLSNCMECHPVKGCWLEEWILHGLCSGSSRIPAGVPPAFSSAFQVETAVRAAAHPGGKLPVLSDRFVCLGFVQKAPVLVKDHPASSASPRHHHSRYVPTSTKPASGLHELLQ